MSSVSAHRPGQGFPPSGCTPSTACSTIRELGALMQRQHPTPSQNWLFCEASFRGGSGHFEATCPGLSQFQQIVSRFSFGPGPAFSPPSLRSSFIISSRLRKVQHARKIPDSHDETMRAQAAGSPTSHQVERRPYRPSHNINRPAKPRQENWDKVSDCASHYPVLISQ